MISYSFLKNNGLEPKSIKKNKNIYIIKTKDNKKYAIKKEQIPKYDYLLSRNFNFFPNNYKLKEYTIYEYIEDINSSKEEKLSDIMNLISILHTKTTRYKNIDIDDYKIIYEKIENEIKSTRDYYLKLNELIDNQIYMSPSEYLLARNISKIYSALSFCKNELDKWYEMIKENPKQRYAYIHNNLDLDHLIRNETPYLISWNKSKIDFPINDIYTLYKKYYNESNFDILLKMYQKRYPLKKEEIKLLFIKISIPQKINFTKNELNNTKKVKDLIIYLDTGDNLIKSHYKKTKED